MAHLPQAAAMGLWVRNCCASCLAPQDDATLTVRQFSAFDSLVGRHAQEEINRAACIPNINIGNY